MAVEELKQRLPLFVRTASDLTLIWHHISEREDPTKPKYKQRRAYISEQFAPLIDYFNGVTPAAEAFFPKGSEHDAYVHIKNILKQATKELLIIDAYMDESIYQLLGALRIAGRLTVRVLTGKVPADFTLEKNKFLKQHASFSIEARTARDFHDRFIFVDGKQCHLLGASIKDAGSRGCTILAITEARIVELIYKYAEQVWIAALVI